MIAMTADIDGWWEGVLFALSWVGIALMCAWLIWRPDAMPWHLPRDLRDLWKIVRAQD